MVQIMKKLPKKYKAVYNLFYLYITTIFRVSSSPFLADACGIVWWSHNSQEESAPNWLQRARVAAAAVAQYLVLLLCYTSRQTSALDDAKEELFFLPLWKSKASSCGEGVAGRLLVSSYAYFKSSMSSKKVLIRVWVSDIIIDSKIRVKHMNRIQYITYLHVIVK